MSWFNVQLKKTDPKAALAKVFSGIRALADQRDGFRTFYLDVLRHPAGPPKYFEHMFDARGAGGPFYGRAWKDISHGWREEKLANSYPGLVGQWKGKLKRSLTSPGSAENILDADDTSGYFGSSVRDDETGKPYAGKFNSKRPIIDEHSLTELKEWFRSDGKEAIIFAADNFKAHWREALKQL